MLACQFGARKVYAVERADVIHLARVLAKANGYSDRIEFFQDLSTNVSLPEKVDVVVSDLHGILPFFQHHIPAIIDARHRLLKPGGKLIPSCETAGWQSSMLGRNANTSAIGMAMVSA
jgi:type I protein arginine methyltransferase